MPLENTIQAELELRKRKREKKNLVAPDDWRKWCKTLFPKYFRRSFAPHHVEFWEWVDAIQPLVKPKAFIAVWDRGGAKSTSAETAVVRIGSKGVRKYGIYVSSTQDKADGHVQTIAAMLESKPYGDYYGKMSKRAVNKFGSVKGWRRDRLITGTGFAVDAFGMDSGLRGAKIEEARPDFIVIDDIDEKFDTTAATLKKIMILTETIFPAGSDDCAILFIQNLITADSIASRLVDNRADFLKNRIVSGPHPAVRNLTYTYDTVENKYIVTGGTPTWSDRTLADIQGKIDDWGLSAFLREAQHEVDKKDGPWAAIEFQHIEYENLPPFVDVQVWIDPAISSTETSNCQGIACGGKTVSGRMIGLFWWEGITTPQKAMETAIEKGYEWGASVVGVETDQGGDTWKSVYNEAHDKVKERLAKRREDEWKAEHPDEELPLFPEIILPKFTSDKAASIKGKAGMATGSKMERNSRMMTDYEKGKVIHMFGTHSVIEKSLWRVPDNPWDLADAHWWLWFNLIGNKKETFGAR